MEYLKRDYDLYINCIPFLDDESESKSDEERDQIFKDRLDQTCELVEKLRKSRGYDLLVVYYGDPHNTEFDFLPPRIYTKDDIGEIFTSNNIRLINSIIENGILKQLKFEKDELTKLGRSLKFSMEKIMLAKRSSWDPCERCELINFNKNYYHLFGKDYIDFLIAFAVREFVTNPLLSTSLSYLRSMVDQLFMGLEIPKSLFRSKVKKVLTRFQFKIDILMFCGLILVIKVIFGGEELLAFLEGHPKIDLLYHPHLAKEWIYDLNDAFEEISEAVVANYDHQNGNLRSLAIKCHNLVMDLFKTFISLIMEVEHTSRFPRRLPIQMIQPYLYRHRESLLLSTLRSIPRHHLEKLEKDLGTLPERPLLQRLIAMLDEN